MGCVIDRYKLNLYCVCLNCRKYRGSRSDFSKKLVDRLKEINVEETGGHLWLT